ncbi:MAG: hypothetical protein O3A01_01670 [bacterium]|nr:hypothetical protein [bacterium]
MSTFEQIGLAVLIVGIAIITLLKVWMHYIKYKHAERFMEQNIADYDGKYAAFQAKHPNSYDQMEQFREMHHDYIMQRDKETKKPD